MSNILIYGIDNLLASYCAARWLQNPGSRIFYSGSSFPPEETTDLVMHAMSQLADTTASVSPRDEIARRLRPASSDLDVDALCRGAAAGVDQVWYFAPAGNAAGEADLLGWLIAACPAIGVREFNYVAAGHESATGAGDERVAQLCREKEIRHRIFRTALIVGKGHPELEQSGNALLRFLAELHSFKSEITERSPQYFDYHALRCLVPAERALNLLPVEVASELLSRIARNDTTLGSSFAIVNPQPIYFTDLCERISIVYGFGVLPAEGFSAMNAVDRAFHERTVEFAGCFAELTGPPDLKAYVTSGLSPETVVFDEDAQMELLESLSRHQEEAWEARERRIADLPSTITRREVAREGAGLTYYVAGTEGPVVVLLNALGQGLEFWYRLIDRLMERHRVVIWELRGTIAPPPPFGLADHVNDLDAILGNENIENCHLVGWCTGAKIAIDFYLRHPQAVLSMAFLNSTFKCQGSPEELDTSYEHNLEFLCRSVVRRPAMAAAIMKTFHSQGEGNELNVLESTDSEEMSSKVLSALNADLKSWALAPFKTEETTLNYAHQLVDFWSNDIRSKAGEVLAPVLLMSAELDQIVSPASSQMAAELLPHARHVHVPAATHYCLYERPEFVAQLLSSFFQSNADVSVADDITAAAALS